MFADSRPGSPSPTLIEEYAQDPELDIDLDDVCTLLELGDKEPTLLPPPCENFNKKRCLTRATCPYPHRCSVCSRVDHCAIECTQDASKGPSPCQERKGVYWDPNTSNSPCAQASLNAAPLPNLPPLGELPSDLVMVVKAHPELFKVISPINIDIFAHLLRNHPNRPFVDSVLNGLREGFWPFAKSPYSEMLRDFSMQKRYHGPKAKFLEEQLEKEIKADRFSKSFGTRLYRGMSCMPIRVAQTNGGKKFRLINNHSAGPHSVNSLIPVGERGVNVDRIDALLRILRSRRLNLDDIFLFKSDVSHAFRIIPMSPYWQALQAIKINGEYYIDRCNTFGNAGSQRLFCAFYSLVLWIAENVWSVPDVLSYVDDNFSWEFKSRMVYYKPYQKRFPEKQARLLELWDILGIPHAIEKQEYMSVLTIIGFRVNLVKMHVSVTDERMEKLVKQLFEVRTAPGGVVSLQDCRKLAGAVNWAFEVNPLLRPGITSLHKEMAKLNQLDDDASVVVSRRVASDLEWLSSELQKSKGVRFARTCIWAPKEAFQTAYMHTSTKGFGIWFPTTKEGYYYRFTEPVRDSVVSYIDAFVMLCTIYQAAKTWRRRLEYGPGRLAVYTSDKATIKMFKELHGPEKLHHVLLLAMELLVGYEMDYVILQKGATENFNIANRLACEGKDILDKEYPDAMFKEFIVPQDIAARAHWKKEHPRSRKICSPVCKIENGEGMGEDAAQGEDGSKDVSTNKEKVLQREGIHSMSMWNAGRSMAKSLTFNFR